MIEAGTQHHFTEKLGFLTNNVIALHLADKAKRRAITLYSLSITCFTNRFGAART